METVLEEAPSETKGFQLEEITVQVSVSAKGGLMLFGSGVEASAGGTMTFKFQRK